MEKKSVTVCIYSRQFVQNIEIILTSTGFRRQREVIESKSRI